MSTKRRFLTDKLLNSFIEKPGRVFAYAIIIPIAIFSVITLILTTWITVPNTSDLIIGNLLPRTLAVTAVLLSALWASTFAIQSMKSSQQTARLRETLNIIRNTELDAEFIKAKNVWSYYRSTENHNLEFAKIMASFILAQHEDFEKQDPSLSILPQDIADDPRSHAEFLNTYFNYHELVSLSIEKGILDEDFFKSWHATNFIRVWNYSVSAVGAIRILHSNPRLYIHWERRVKLWGDALNVRVKDVAIYTLPDLVEMTKPKS